MRKHNLHCQNPWFSFIRDGKKIVEGRKNLPKFRLWQPGDHVIFQCGSEQFLTKIIAMRRYNDLLDYLNTEGVENVLPGVKSLKEAMDIYLQWSTKEEIAKIGFLAIEVQLLND